MLAGLLWIATFTRAILASSIRPVEPPVRRTRPLEHRPVRGPLLALRRVAIIDDVVHRRQHRGLHRSRLEPHRSPYTAYIEIDFY